MAIFVLLFLNNNIKKCGIMSRLAEKKKELAEREANKKNDLKKSWNRDER
ncbi:hypothetical protein [Eubacterium ventriosum]|nr:hypothetical protein [Eubacterium ventriosum]